MHSLGEGCVNSMSWATLKIYHKPGGGFRIPEVPVKIDISAVDAVATGEDVLWRFTKPVLDTESAYRVQTLIKLK